MSATTGGGPTSCARSSSSRTTSSSRTAAVAHTRRARRGCCARRRSTEGVPRWLRDQGRGWMTAEYSLLPASTGERTEREASRGKQQGPDRRDPAADRPRGPRGRRLRGARRADAVARLRRPPGRRRHPLRGDLAAPTSRPRGRSTASASAAALRDSVAAVSVGIVDGEPLLDLDYEEDSGAEVDLNVVMTGDGRLVEVQATAERAPFARRRARRAARSGCLGIETIGAAQRQALDAAGG